MNEHLLSFLNKLNQYQQQDLLLFQPNQSYIDDTLKQLSKRNLSLSEDKLNILSYLLQKIEISIFSNQELLEVSKLRIDLLTSNVNEFFPHVISPDDGFYDTGSIRTRIYMYNHSSIHFSDIAYMEARKAISITTLINQAINLY